MRTRLAVVAAIAAVLCITPAFASTVTVVIPDPSPQQFIYYGTGDASVTYSNVLFVQQAALGNASLYDVGPLYPFGGLPAVLSSQTANVGADNIMIVFPNPTTFFSVDFGTYFPATVTFLLGNGDSFTQAGTGAGYHTPDFFSVTDIPFSTILITASSTDLAMHINNITYNTSSSTPEPGTLIMLGTGVLAAAGAARRKLLL
jgi:hypothetical protein